MARKGIYCFNGKITGVTLDKTYFDNVILDGSLIIRPPYNYTLSSNGEYYTVSNGENAGSVVIPATYRDKPIEWIDGWMGCKEIHDVTIEGDSISVESAGFMESNIFEFRVKDYGGIYVGRQSFQDCKNLYHLNAIIFSLDEYAFQNCEALETIYLGTNIIPYMCFDGCSSLYRIYYTGSPDEWESRYVQEGNDAIENATVYYYSDDQPEEDGYTYWHYDRYGDVRIWGYDCLEGHTYVTEPRVEATCSSTGLTEGQYCSVCGYVLKKQYVIPMKSHTEGEWVVVTPPTEVSQGMKHKYCEVCDSLLATEKIAPIDCIHPSENKIATVAPTCEEQGYTEYQCTVCGRRRKDDIKYPLGHIEDDYWHIDIYPTGYTEGSEHRECLRCGESVEDRYIPKVETADWNLDYTLLDDGTYSVKALEGRTMPYHLEIPSTYNGVAVTKIEDSAFEGCGFFDGAITTVTIPRGIKYIGNYAFQDCPNLAEVIIPNTVEYVGRQAFYDCGITVYCECAKTEATEWHKEWSDSTDPNTVVWDNECFDGHDYCEWYTVIEPTITTDGVERRDCQRDGCYHFETRPIPATGLFSFSLLDDGTYSVKAASTDISGDIVIPALYEGEFVTQIEEGGFSGCKKITSISIPFGVTAIPQSAFEGCSNLSSVVMGSNVNSIETKAFRGCTNLNDINIPDRLTNIGARAFENCITIESLIIPESVTTIGTKAFYGCSKLTLYCEAETAPAGWESLSGVKKVEMCYGVTESKHFEVRLITDSADYEGYEILSAYDSSTSTNMPSEVRLPSRYENEAIVKVANQGFYNHKGLVRVTIPDSVIELGQGSFASCGNLTEVVLSKNVRRISMNAFASCSRLKGIVIPNSVNYIGWNAFGSCVNLERIYIPNSVTQVNADAFKGCTNLTIYCEAASKPNGWASNWNSSNCPVVWGSDPITQAYKHFKFTERNDGSYEVSSIYKDGGLTYMPTSVDIPSTYNGEAVTGIATDGFGGEGGIESITLPDSIVTIGHRAFYWCDSIKGIKLPNSVWVIGSHAFSNCSSLNLVKLPKHISHIPTAAFAYCYSLNGIDVPDSVTEIGDDAFFNNINLTSVTFGANSNIKKIGRSAFSNCAKLSAIKLPEGCAEIASSAFNSCGSLKTVEIPSTVTTMGSRVFSAMSGLTVRVKMAMKPIGWADDWCDNSVRVVWGYTGCTDGHDYDSVVTPPTCTEKGYTTHTCSRCGDTYTDNETNALGHDYKVTKIVGQNCIKDGYILYTCSRCGDTYTEVIPADGVHSYSATVVAPTCTEQGYTEYICDECGDTYKDNYTDALGHSWGAWKEITPAECEIEGQEERTCSVCGEVETRVIPALGHDYVDSIVEPDCDDGGYTLHTCRRCGHTYRDNYTDPTGLHNWSDWNIEIPPDCTVEGTQTCTCEDCGKVISERIPKTDHILGDWIIDKQPTTEEEGSMHQECIVCGINFGSFPIPKLEDTNTYLVTESGEFLTDEQGEKLII